MSDFHAIGGVSASIKALLRDRMEVPAELPTGTFQITVSPPPTAHEEGDGIEPARVNLFLYQVTRNGCLANQEIPGHGHPAAYGHPPLSLDLRFLLTGYGTSEMGGEVDETVGQFLLGSAMRVLHDVPVITEELLDAHGAPILHPSLLGEFEKIKISLDALSLEDLAKVWTATTFPYRLSAPYTVSVVQIESRTPRRRPQPVGEPIPGHPEGPGPHVQVLPVVSPQLSEVRVLRGGRESRFPFARIGDRLVLIGSGLAGGDARVRIGGVDATAGIVSRQQGRLVVQVPDAAELQPGAQPVSVSVGGDALHSNLVVFVLVPRVDAAVLALGAVPRTLTLHGSRLWAESLSGQVLLGEEGVDKAEYLGVPTETDLVVALPDTLPARQVRCLSSAPLADPLVVVDPDLEATIGGTGPKALILAPTPSSASGAAAALERALRSVGGGGERFTGARVAAAAGRLWVVPGELDHPVVFAGPAAGSLGLDTPTEVLCYLSGRLAAAPRLSAAQPRLRVTFGGTTRTVVLAGRPASRDEAAALLRDALRAAGPPAAFSQAEVVVLGEQLLVVPGAPALADLRFEPVPGPGPDPASVVELRLALDYRVRVRVGGAEDVDQLRRALP